jgi:hypothetical protein
MLCQLGNKPNLGGRNARKNKAQLTTRRHFRPIKLLHRNIGVKIAPVLRSNKEGRLYLLIFVLSLIQKA